MKSKPSGSTPASFPHRRRADPSCRKKKRPLLSLFPTDVATPFMRNDSMPIIPLASLVGGALLILGDRARRVAEFIEQANGVTQLLMELMGALLPLFIFLVVSRMFWTGSLAALSFSLAGDGLRDALDPKLKD